MERLAGKSSISPKHATGAASLTCDTCLVRNQALCGRFSGDELAAINQIARRRRLQAGQQITLDDEAPEYFGIILSGAVKLTKVLPDGRQQIVGLLFPSDFVGRPFGQPGASTAEAATEVQLCSFPAGPFERIVREHPGIQHQLFRFALGQLDAAQDWMLLLGRKTAREKLISLLLMIAQRLHNPGCAPVGATQRAEFALPLSRSDIADFLGLTLETVSRQLHILKSETLIRLEGSRGITIPDLARLRASSSHPAS